MALKYTKQINEDECIGDSLDTINASFSALDEGLQDVQDVVNNVEGAVENVLRQGDFVGNWITMPQNLTNSNVNYFLKYVGGDTVYKWQPDTAIYSTGSNVGIGTTSPSRKLHITENANAPGLRIDSTQLRAGAEILGLSGGYIRLRRTGTSRDYLVELTSVLSGTNLADGVGVGGAINVLGDYFDIRTGSTVNTLSSLLFVTPNGGGRLGIGGVTNPLAKLDIGAPVTGGAEIRLRGSSSSLYDFVLDTQGDGFQIMRYNKGTSAGGTQLFSSNSTGAVSIASSTNVASLGVTSGVTAMSAAFTNNTQAVGINTDSTYANIELGSNSGAYIDLKQPNSDNYDLRISHLSNTSSIEAIGILNITSSQTLSVANVVFKNKNVGVSTGNPETVVHVLSAEGCYLTLESDPNGNFSGAAAEEQKHPGIIFKQDGGIKRGFVGYFGNSADRNDCLRLMADKQLLFATGTTTNRPSFTNTAYASATTAMVITSAGKVGIGTNITESVITNKELEIQNTSLKLMVDGGLWANDIRTGSLSASKIYFDVITNQSLNTDFVLAESIRSKVLYLSGGTAFGETDSQSINYVGYNGRTIAPYHLSATYITFARGQSVNDIAFLRQIGGPDNFHLTLDLHDNHAGSDGQAFSIRNINSSDEVQPLLHIDAFGRTGFGTSTPTANVQVVGSNSYPALQVTQTGSGHALLIQDSSGEPNNLVVTGSGTLLKGISASVVGAGGDVQISKHNGYSSLVMSSFSNNESYHSGYLRFLRSKSGLSGRMGTSTGVKTDNTIGFIDFYADNDEGGWGQGTGVYAFADADWTSTSTPARLGFYTTAPGSNSWSERLRIASSGNVGIGTTTPTAKLHLRQTGNANAFMVDDVTTNTTPFVINKDGWVGVGTTAPAGIMHVNGSVITTGIITNSKATSLTFASGTTQDYSSSITLNGSPAPQILFNVSNSEKMVLTSDGNLGIGTSVPEYKLHVVGATQANELRSTGPLYTSTSNLQNNLLFTSNQINASWNDVANVRELALNYTTNGDTQYRDLRTYNGKREPIIWANGATKKVTFYGDVQIMGSLSASNTQGQSSPPVGDGVPVGTISYFAGLTAPPGWEVCDGRTLTNARTIYPLLWSRITFSVDTNNGRSWGRSGTNNLVLPDLRGEFVRGWDGTGTGARGADSNRVFGTLQLDAFKTHRHKITDNGGADEDNQGLMDVAGSSQPASRGYYGWTDYEGTSQETRPRNIALLPCIKVFNSADIVESSINVAAINSTIAQLETQISTIKTPKVFNTDYFKTATLPANTQITKTITLPAGSYNGLLQVYVGPGDAGSTTSMQYTLTDGASTISTGTATAEFRRSGGAGFGRNIHITATALQDFQLTQTKTLTLTLKKTTAGGYPIYLTTFSINPNSFS